MYYQAPSESDCRSRILPSFSSFLQLKKGCVRYKQRYLHEVLANPFVKLDQENCDKFSWLSRHGHSWGIKSFNKSE